MNLINCLICVENRFREKENRKRMCLIWVVCRGKECWGNIVSVSAGLAGFWEIDGWDYVKEIKVKERWS